MTPLPTKKELVPAEQAYQKAHIGTRNEIERFFGCWKSKFQCLKFLRLHMSTTLNVVSACAVLWNFLLAEEDPTEEPFEADPYAGSSDSHQTETPANCLQRRSEGMEKRRLLIATNF